MVSGEGRFRDCHPASPNLRSGASFQSCHVVPFALVEFFAPSSPLSAPRSGYFHRCLRAYCFLNLFKAPFRPLRGLPTRQSCSWLSPSAFRALPDAYTPRQRFYISLRPPSATCVPLLSSALHVTQCSTSIQAVQARATRHIQEPQCGAAEAEVARA